MDDCQHCGACCAAYRVDFSVQELESAGGQVPDGLTVAVSACAAPTTCPCALRGADRQVGGRPPAASTSGARPPATN
jgi:Fe-S-cluster containining protein